MKPAVDQKSTRYRAGPLAYVGTDPCVQQFKAAILSSVNMSTHPRDEALDAPSALSDNEAQEGLKRIVQMDGWMTLWVAVCRGMVDSTAEPISLAVFVAGQRPFLKLSPTARRQSVDRQRYAPKPDHSAERSLWLT